MAETKPSPNELMSELQGMVNAHVKLAFEQYKELRETYWHSEKQLEWLKSVTPKNMHESLDKTKKWMDEQYEQMESNLDKVISDSRTWKTDSGVPAPALKEITEMVNRHMGMAFKEYKALKDKYGSPAKATIAFIKSAAPDNAHEALDRLDSWIEEQTQNIESYVETSMKGKDTAAPSSKKKKK